MFAMVLELLGKQITVAHGHILSLSIVIVVTRQLGSM
jgi:hypothetical protein